MTLCQAEINELMVRAAQDEPGLRGLSIEMLNRINVLERQATHEWVEHHVSQADGSEAELAKFWGEEVEPEHIQKMRETKLTDEQLAALPPDKRDNYFEAESFMEQEIYEYHKDRFHRLCKLKFQIALSHILEQEPLLSGLSLEFLKLLSRHRFAFSDLHYLEQEDVSRLPELTPEAVRAAARARRDISLHDTDLITAS